MWSNFDLGKLGEQLSAVAGEALQKATADVEKSIDTTLGIKGGPEGKTAQGQAPILAQGPAPNARGHSDVASPTDSAAPVDASTAAKPVQKKVVKKIIRRVVKGGADSAAAVAGSKAAAVGASPPDARDGVQDASAVSASRAPAQAPPASEHRVSASGVADAQLSSAAQDDSLPTDPANGASSNGPSHHDLVQPPSGTPRSEQPPPEPEDNVHVSELGDSSAPAQVNGTTTASPAHSHAGQTADAAVDSQAGPAAAAPQHLGTESPGGEAVREPSPSPPDLGPSEPEPSPSAAPALTDEADPAPPVPQPSTERLASAGVGDGWDAWPDDDVDRPAGGAPEQGDGWGAPASAPTSDPAEAPAASEPLAASEAVSAGDQEATRPQDPAPNGDEAAADKDPVTEPSAPSAPALASSSSSNEGPAASDTAGGTPASARPARLVKEKKGKASPEAGKAEEPAAPAPAAALSPLTVPAAANGFGVSRAAGEKSSGGGGGTAPVAGGPSAIEEELRRQVTQLREQVGQRDAQLQAHALQVADLQQVVSSLQTRNEQLALKSAQLSEADFESVRTEFEQRLAATERKVYALTKERDALRKGSEKMAEYGALIKEKDDIIKQVMDEGEKLSKKQVELEGIIKRVRGQLAAVEGERDKLASRLAAEEAAVADLRKTKAKLEKDLVAAGEQAKADLESQREHFELLLQKAKSDQVDAEERARDAATQGLARKLRESEARCEALAESCAELRDALDRQRQAADLREEMLKADLNDLERRCQAAELRHQDLASKMPEATRPLLRQIEGMQAAMDAQAEAWRGAEAALQARVQDAEMRAASAAERERLAMDKMQMLSTKASGLDASLTASRNEVRALNEQLEEAQQGLAAAREAAREAARQAEVLAERCRLQERQLEQMDSSLRESRDAERAARAAAEHDVASLRRDYERRLAEAEAELGTLRAQVQAEAMRRAPEPPAMAAPGYRWQLVKEGEARDHHHGDLQSSLHHASAPDLPAASTSSALRNPTSSSSVDFLTSSLRGSGAGAPGLSPAGGGDGMHTVMASELESLRAALRAKTGELQAAQQQVAELEATRDRLAEELVAGSARTEAAAEALQQRERLEAELADLRTKLNNALELVGERDEQVEELLADLQDVKCMYKDQIEFMCQQLAELQQGAAPAAGGAGGVPSHLGAMASHLGTAAASLGHGHGHGSVHGGSHHGHGHGPTGLPPYAGAPGKPAAGLDGLGSVGLGSEGSVRGGGGSGMGTRRSSHEASGGLAAGVPGSRRNSGGGGGGGVL